jgi:hypothetical protein
MQPGLMITLFLNVLSHVFAAGKLHPRQVALLMGALLFHP